MMMMIMMMTTTKMMKTKMNMMMMVMMMMMMMMMSTACQMLVCYAKELGGRFESYIEEVAKLMIPLLKFYFHDGVRCSAAQCIAPLVNCTMESRGEAAAK